MYELLLINNFEQIYNLIKKYIYLIIYMKLNNLKIIELNCVINY